VQPDKSDHTAVSKWVMYIIATTIAVCTLGVIVFKGVDSMPHNAIGIVGAAVFFVAALAMAQYVQRESDHH
jgi:ABC-type proline/glycine betaine transport system permease subunit